MFDSTPHPILTRLEKVELKGTIEAEGDVLSEMRIKIAIDIDDDTLKDLVKPGEAKAAASLLDEAVKSQADDKPHTYTIKVKREFAGGEFCFSRGSKEETLSVLAEVKNQPEIKVVGDETILKLTLDGTLTTEKMGIFSKWVGGNVKLVVNPLQKVLPLKDAA